MISCLCVCVFERFRAAIFQSQNREKKVEKSLYTMLKREAYHNHRQDKVAGPGDICCRAFVFVHIYADSKKACSVLAIFKNGPPNDDRP